jgi:curved DNA-binding protein
VKDYYQILGVERTASESDIKAAYRKLASRHHPDRGGDTSAFQEIQQAYSVLSDPVKRKEYDSPTPNFASGMNFGPGFDFDQIFEMFGARVNPRRTPSARLILTISLYDAIVGGRRAISVGTPHGQSTVEIDLPPGTEDGDTIRYPGLGPGNTDLVITFRLRDQEDWYRKGSDLIHEYKISIWDLILGTTITVKSLNGNQITITVPTNTQPNTMLRVGCCQDLLDAVEIY